MYEVLKQKAYKKMTADGQIAEFKKWLEDQFNETRAILRSVAGTMPESDPDIDTVISADLRELPKLINDYDEESAAYAILKYRLEKGIDNCGDSILDSDMFGLITSKFCADIGDGEDDCITIEQQRNLIDELRVLCIIFGFDSIRESLTLWRP